MVFGRPRTANSFEGNTSAKAGAWHCIGLAALISAKSVIPGMILVPDARAQDYNTHTPVAAGEYMCTVGSPAYFYRGRFEGVKYIIVDATWDVSYGMSSHHERTSIEFIGRKKQNQGHIDYAENENGSTAIVGSCHELEPGEPRVTVSYRGGNGFVMIWSPTQINSDLQAEAEAKARFLCPPGGTFRWVRPWVPPKAGQFGNIRTRDEIPAGAVAYDIEC